MRATTPKRACRTAIDLLALAHEHACEADLANALDTILEAGDLPDLGALRSRFCERTSSPAPVVSVIMPPASSYDALIRIRQEAEVAL